MEKPQNFQLRTKFKLNFKIVCNFSVLFSFFLIYLRFSQFWNRQIKILSHLQWKLLLLDRFRA